MGAPEPTVREEVVTVHHLCQTILCLLIAGHIGPLMVVKIPQAKG